MLTKRILVLFFNHYFCNKMNSGRELVTVSFEDLQNPAYSLEKIEAAFGPSGLGIIAVSHIPGYSECRKNLLPLAQQLSKLPSDILDDLKSPESNYAVGWSTGLEQYFGEHDVSLGSFYANAEVEEMIRGTGPPIRNIWPSNALPEF